MCFCKTMHVVMYCVELIYVLSLLEKRSRSCTCQDHNSRTWHFLLYGHKYYTSVSTKDYPSSGKSVEVLNIKAFLPYN